MPEISIIVPVYNVEKYIHRCVDSILAQTFTDFELILVDDGSPDNCGAICDEYAAKDGRVRVIHKENGGLSSARNAGLKVSTGYYLLFCDSDDFVGENWCNNLVQQIETGKKKYIFGGIVVVEDSGSSTHEKINVPSEYLCKWHIKDFIPLQIKGWVGFACNVLYDATIIREKGLLFPTDYVVEDFPFNLQYLNYVDELQFSGEAGYYYYQDKRATLSRRYYKDGFRKWREKYALTRAFLNEKVSGAELVEIRHQVANYYLYFFLNALDNTFDTRNHDIFLKKLRVNQQIVQDEVFQDCLSCADLKGENRRYIWFLKARCYIGAYVVKKLAWMKRKMIRRSR